MERGVGLSCWLEARVLLLRLTRLVIPKYRSLRDLKRKGLEQLVGTKPTPERCPVAFWNRVLFLLMLLSLHVNIPALTRPRSALLLDVFFLFFLPSRQYPLSCF